MSSDLTVHKKTLRGVALKTTDFSREPRLLDATFLNALLQRAEMTLEIGFQSLELSSGRQHNKPTYKIKTLEHELVLRLLCKSISRLTGVRQSNRIEIVKALKVLLSEGVNYRVYRLDISKFYESIEVDDLRAELRHDRGFSRQSAALLDAFFDELQIRNILNLPRGMAISAVLSEYALRKFDEIVERDSHVYFYKRFVDDIVLITSGNEATKPFLKHLGLTLPNGLKFNLKKTRVFDLTEKASSNQTVIAHFDYLGYQLSITNRSNSSPKSRMVTADISTAKTNKLKTRVIKSALRFIRDGRFDDFLDRLKLISGNVSIYDHARHIKRNSGIYYNYQLIDFQFSNSLDELDDFMRRLFLSKAGPISSRLAIALNNKQRREVMKISFRRGFSNKTFYNFKGDHLVHLMECWKYG